LKTETPRTLPLETPQGDVPGETFPPPPPPAPTELTVCFWWCFHCLNSTRIQKAKEPQKDILSNAECGRKTLKMPTRVGMEKTAKKNLLPYKDCEKKRNTLFSKSFGRKILSNFNLP
jgi:hypothetical protein